MKTSLRFIFCNNFVSGFGFSILYSIETMEFQRFLLVENSVESVDN